MGSRRIAQSSEIQIKRQKLPPLKRRVTFFCHKQQKKGNQRKMLLFESSARTSDADAGSSSAFANARLRNSNSSSYGGWVGRWSSSGASRGRESAAAGAGDRGCAVAACAAPTLKA